MNTAKDFLENLENKKKNETLRIELELKKIENEYHQKTEELVKDFELKSKTLKVEREREVEEYNYKIKREREITNNS